MKRKALGKGLAALLPEAPEMSGEEFAEIDVQRIDPNPFQPRRQLQKETLQELAKSLSQDGVIQPILVRRVGSRYQIIAGERRWRAARLAGLARIPAVIRPVEEERLLELALIENIQRENLNPIEEAAAYSKLVTELGLSQEKVAERVGKDRSTIANLLRLLRLPEPIRDAIARRKLSPGHARPLLSIRDSKLQVQIAREVAEKGLSVREVERRVQSLAAAPKAKAAEVATPPVDANTRAAEDRLRQALGTRVRIIRKGRTGTIEIAFHSEEELGGIYEVLLRGARSKFHRVK